MRNVDAPRAGWYPDPRGRTRLRWWDGLDWTEIYRAPPSDAELIAAEENRAFFAENQGIRQGEERIRASAAGRRDTQDIIAEVRNVARSEVDRAAQEFSNRATTALRGYQPLVTEYTSKVFRFIRIVSVIAVLLLLGWLVFQIFAQVSLFDWIGDRIDNLTDDDAGAAHLVVGVLPGRSSP